ncbi:MAG: M48 family metallopeptidase [Elusimicrobia bacterium]|nr:M48 family metallopeptidase [Elusimicrobiota bacterium]
MNLYEQQTSNKRWTWVMVGVFVALFTFLGLGFDVFVLGMDPPLHLPWGTLAAVIGGFLMAANSFWNGPSMVLAAAKARPADPAVFEERQFINIVQEMATASGLPMPKVYVVPDPDPNAFATGTKPANSVVAATEGLLKSLNREELQGVIGHEMSHIRNYDVRLLTILAALAGAIALLSDWAGRSFRFGPSGGRSRSREGKGSTGAIVLILFGIWIILMILAPILSQILALAVSRKREFLADASGAELTRNPLALASALDKIEKAAAPTASINQGLAHLCVADPKGSLMGNKEGFLADILATHPPIRKRILTLRVMAYDHQGAIT